MPNDIVDALIDEKIRLFRSAFQETAKVVFYDETKPNKLRHPGEFGTYREAIVHDLLLSFVPQSYAIESGFAVNSKNDVSKQLDIVVFDPSVTPRLETQKRQRFFPVETIVAVGEIRSSLSLSSLKDALLRLAHVKKLQSDSRSGTIRRWIGERLPDYSSSNLPFDQVCTFVICDRFDFNLKKATVTETFDEIYGDIPYQNRHNMILSITDGLLLYSGVFNGERLECGFPWNYETNSPVGNAVMFTENDTPHLPVKFFCNTLFQHACHATIGFADISKYVTERASPWWRQERDPGA